MKLEPESVVLTILFAQTYAAWYIWVAIVGNYCSRNTNRGCTYSLLQFITRLSPSACGNPHGMELNYLRPNLGQ